MAYRRFSRSYPTEVPTGWEEEGRMCEEEHLGSREARGPIHCFEFFLLFFVTEFLCVGLAVLELTV